MSKTRTVEISLPVVAVAYNTLYDVPMDATEDDIYNLACESFNISQIEELETPKKTAEGNTWRGPIAAMVFSIDSDTVEEIDEEIEG